MPESTLTSKGQTTLPKQVREALGVKPGDQLRYLVLDDGEVRIFKPQPIRDMSGALQRVGQGPVSLDEMDAAVGRGAADEG